MDIPYLYPDVMGDCPIYSQPNASDIKLYIMRSRMSSVDQNFPNNNLIPEHLSYPLAGANPDSISHPRQPPTAYCRRNKLFSDSLIRWTLPNFRAHAMR